MKRTWFILLLCIQALGITARSNKELYKTLDSLISCYDKLTAEKEQRINSIKQSMGNITLTPEQTYDLNIRLYDEYMAYRFDSAYYYINKNVTALRGQPTISALPPALFAWHTFSLFLDSLAECITCWAR